MINDGHLYFSTGWTGEKVRETFDDEIDRITMKPEDCILKELDVSKMDAGRNSVLRNIEVQIYDELKEYLQIKSELPIHALESVERNMLRIENKFEVITYDKGKSTRHMTGTYNGTTLSGWPFMTTWGNTVTMITFGI